MTRAGAPRDWRPARGSPTPAGSGGNVRRVELVDGADAGGVAGGERPLVGLAQRGRRRHGVVGAADVGEAVDVAELVGGGVLQVVAGRALVATVALIRREE